MRSLFNGIEAALDHRLSIEGGTVVALAFIPRSTIIARISKRSILSRRTAPLPIALLDRLNDDEPAIWLSMCVLHELSKGTASKWATYFQSCPEEIGIASLWERNSLATEWIKHTALDRSVAGFGTNLLRLTTFYTSRISTLLPALYPLSPPTLNQFLHAYALVSTRGFVVDAFHGLSLVPIACAFNHIELNHVQFEVDYWVCPTCGSSNACAHDDSVDMGDFPGEGSEADTSCQLSTVVEIDQGEEVFNSYGHGLSNTDLLQNYGFILDANPFDRIEFTLDYLNSLPGKVILDEDKLRCDSIIEARSGQNYPWVENATTVDKSEYFINSDAQLSRSLLKFLIVASDITERSTREAPSVQVRRMIVEFCQNEIKSGHRPELSGGQILAMLDNNKSQIRDKSVQLAMEYTAQQRMLLECTVALWTRTREEWAEGDGGSEDDAHEV